MRTLDPEGTCDPVSDLPTPHTPIDVDPDRAECFTSLGDRQIKALARLTPKGFESRSTLGHLLLNTAMGSLPSNG